MKQKLLSFFALVLVFTQGWAAPIDESKALNVARNFTTSMAGHDKFTAASTQQLKLVHAEPSSINSKQAVYYVYNTQNSHVIVSGDDRAVDILGYGEGQLDINNIPDGMKFMLGMFKEQIDYLFSHPKLQVEKEISTSPSLQASSVDILITTKWDQLLPYCYYCPALLIEGYLYPCPTGCAATALAQIMYYWKYPSTAPSLSAYTTETLGISMDKLDSRTIAWSNMKTSYSSTDTGTSAEAVAWLMRYVGQAEHMDYCPDGSGADVYDALSAAKKFSYNSNAKAVFKTDPYTDQELKTDEEWATLIQTELTAKRPVFFGGQHKIKTDTYAGHGFIVDGYNASTNKYHINWGASGNSNGYFPLNAFKDGNKYTYNYYQFMITHLCPQPVITPSVSTLSFGTTAKNQAVSKTLTVKGSYLTGNLTLTANSSYYTVSPTTITAAQAANGVTVTVTYKPTVGGTHNATLTIKGGDAANKTVSLSGKCAEITSSVSTLSFGTTAKNKAISKTLTVKGTNLTGSLTLSTNSSYYTVSPTTITAANAANGVTVTVTYKPTVAGTHNATLTIKGGSAANKTVSLSGKCAEITSSVSSLSFGTTVKNKAVSKTLTVKGTNLSGSLTLSTNNSYYTVSPTTITAANAANGVTVTVTYKPTAAGSHSATLTIKGGSAADKTVSLSGKCGGITSSVSSLNFGTTAKNKAATKTFTITGTNLSESVTLSTNSSYFTVSPTTITGAQAANGYTVTVTYKPTVAGTHNATLTIKSGSNVTKTVSLSGKCAEITSSVSSLSFGTTAKSKAVSKTLTVKGTNLTGSLTLSTNSSYYTVSPTTITAANAVNGVTVTVTYKPTVAGTHNATLTIKGGSAANKTVSLSGKCAEITTNTNSLLFAGYRDSRTLTVKGTNLTGSLTLRTNNTNFTVSPTTITAAQAAAGYTVTVRCNVALHVQRAAGTLTISGGSAASKTVTLTFDASGIVPYAGLVLPDDGQEDELNGDELEFSLKDSNTTTTALDESAVEVKIYAEGQNIIIESPVEQSALICDAIGRARSVKLQIGRNEIPVNAGGLYIVRVREKSVKLMLK